MIGRSKKGQALMEVAVVGIILIPIALFMLDLAVLVMCNMTNDSVAKNAARAAANQPVQASAQQAAQHALDTVKTSSIITDLKIKNFNYTGNHDSVTVATQMSVQVPVPFPFLDKVAFVAQSVQPIVAE